MYGKPEHCAIIQKYVERDTSNDQTKRYQPIKFHTAHSVLQDPNLYLRCSYRTKYDPFMIFHWKAEDKLFCYNSEKLYQLSTITVDDQQ